MNYRCNEQFYVGVYSYKSSGEQIAQLQTLIINPSESWNKIYVNLTPEVANLVNVNASKYKIYFGAVKRPDVSSLEIYLDNIKLIH
jgi:hypothetical protein